jgi:hypothetical protein
MRPADGSLAPVQRPRVIYVMGAGRSGSTIFGVTLGNCDGVFYAGELDAWLVRAGEPQLDGERQRRFWGAVRAQVEGAQPLFGNVAQRCLERSMALFRPHLWRTRRRLRGEYGRVAEQLYRAVARVSGEGCVVDTSHYPLRARELQALDGIELHLVYLVRDPQSVVASFNRRDVAQYSKSTLTTNVYLWLTHALATLVFLRHPRERRLLVRYEDFIADPPSTVRRVLELVGSDAPPPALNALAVGVPFQGNRLIRSVSIALRPQADASPRRSRTTALLQLPWAFMLRRLHPATASVG